MLKKLEILQLQKKSQFKENFTRKNLAICDLIPQ